MTLYRDILRQAFKGAWHYKYLWFFGLFSLLLGNSGEIELLFRSYSQGNVQGLLPGLEGIRNTGILSLSIFSNLSHLARTEPFALFVTLSIFLVVVLISLFLLWLSVVSQAALVNNSAKIKTNKKHDFQAGLSAGTKYFWPVLGYNLLLRGSLYLVFVLFSYPIISSISKANYSVFSLLFVIAFIIFVPLSIIVSFIIKYAIAYMIVKGEKFFDSIRKGWRLFMKNWLVSLEMAFVLFIINFLAGLALVLVFLILAIPFLFVAFLFAKFTLYFNFWAMVLVALIIAFIFVAIFGAFLSAFHTLSWTSLFIELVSRGGVSKLVRIFGKE